MWMATKAEVHDQERVFGGDIAAAKFRIEFDAVINGHRRIGMKKFVAILPMVKRPE